MLLSEMFGVERGETFEIKECADRFMVVVDDFYTEFLRIQGHGKGEWVYADTYAIYQVIKSAPSGIIHLPPPLTNEQKEQLQHIYGLGGRYLTKGPDGKTVAFENKPRKDTHDWVTSAGYIRFVLPLRHVSNLVSWSDPEPFDIGKALGIKD